MNKHISLNVWTLFLLTIAYSIISLILFILTSGGWATLIFLIYGGVLFGGVVLMQLIITIIRHWNNKTNIALYKPLIFLTLGVQALAYLFNIGDCGDGGGTYFFLQRILSSADVCTGTSVSFLVSTISGGAIIYFYIPLVFLSLFFVKTNPNPTTPSTTESIWKI